MRLSDFPAWVEAMPLAAAVGSTGVYPFVSAMHILAIALVIGSIVPVDLRLMRAVGPQFDAALPSLVRFALVGFTVAAMSGALLASVRLSEYVRNPAFLAKGGILAALGANAWLLRRNAAGGLAAVIGGRWAVPAATLSLLLWVAAVLAGRWIAFV